ncbi:MAG: double zinc ribbon domain-containing protein [Streptosporangiaceae bacterium]
MWCPRCRHENPDGARFCLHCGAQPAASCAGCGMLPPPQELLREPAHTLVDSAVHAWDAGQAAEAEGLLRRALRRRATLGTCEGTRHEGVGNDD